MNELSGHCLCTTVSFIYNGELGPSSYCHCDDCRRCTGSAFNISIRLERDKMIIKGQDGLGTYTYVADSGNSMSRLFCKHCGSPIMTLHPSKPQFAWIKAGILDQPDSIKPIQETWTSRMVKWAKINVIKSFSESATK